MMIIKDWKKEILTIPNLLSLFRLALIPVYMVIYLNATEQSHYFISAAILAVSCLTDMIDGQIARRFNMITTVGKILDPLADKVTQLALIICLAYRYAAIRYMIVLFLAKEIFQVIAAAINLKKGKMLDGALITGKICTTVLFTSLIIMIMIPTLDESFVNILVIIDSIFLLIAFIDYILAFFGKWKKVKDINPSDDK